MMNPNHDDKLRAMLIEDLGEDDADLYLDVARQIRDMPQPEPAFMSTAALIEHLQPAPISLWERLLDWYPVLLLRSQMRVVQREIWWASLIVLVIGMLVTLVHPYVAKGEQYLPFNILAPMVAGVGIALLYDPENRYEIEDAAGVGVALLLLARLTLIFAFDLAVSVGCSAVLVAANSDLTLHSLILTWLMPMAFLSAMAFFLSIYTRNTLFSITVSFGIWVLHLFLSSGTPTSTLLYALSLPGLSNPTTRPALAVVSVMMVLAAMGLVSRSEKRLGEFSA